MLYIDDMTTALYAPPMSDRLTRAETARHLGVSTQTVDRYADAGRLTRHKNDVTARVYFDAREVERLRAQREQAATR